MGNSNPMELSSFGFRGYLYWGKRGKNVKNSEMRGTNFFKYFKISIKNVRWDLCDFLNNLENAKKSHWGQGDVSLEGRLSRAQYHRTMEPLGVTAPNSDLVVMHNLKLKNFIFRNFLSKITLFGVILCGKHVGNVIFA